MSTTPRRLGQYELLHYLGRGSVGEVWKARDLALHRDVAVKIFHSDLQRSEPHFLTRLTSEGRTLASLRHPNIVPIHDLKVSRPPQSQETTAYMVMDFIEGPTLREYIRANSQKGTFPALTDLVYLFTSIGIAIDHAHQAGVVHGNIKPGNIPFNKQDIAHFQAGEPLLTDFGLTQLAGLMGDNGTPYYISPEQAQGKPASNRSDIYALGVILYELCTGVVPFRDESSVAVMMQHMQALPTPPLLINSAIPPALSEVILRAMSKDPIARFPMASLLAAAIADACSLQSTLYIGEQAPGMDEIDNNQSNPSSLLGVMQPSGSMLRYPPIPQQQRAATGQTAPLQQGQNSLAGQFKLPNRPSLSGIGPSPQPPLQTSPIAPSLSGSVPENSPDPRTIASLPARPLKVTKAAPTNTGPVPTTQRQPAIPSLVERTALTPPPPPSSFTNTAEVPSYNRSNSLSQPQNTASTPIPMRTLTPARQLYNRAPNYVIIASLLIIVLILGGAIGVTLLPKGDQTPTETLPGDTPAGRVFLLDSTEGRNSQLRVDLYQFDVPAIGKEYFAWMLKADQSFLPLGPLTVDLEGTASITYAGDEEHTNLMSIIQGVTITLEEAASSPQTPSTEKVYEAAFSTTQLQHLKDILYITPNFPENTSLATALLDTISSIKEKATSVNTSFGGDNELVIRQASRIIDGIDGTEYAEESGDRPSNVPSYGRIDRGLLSAPDQSGIIDLFDQKLDALSQTLKDDDPTQKNIEGVKNALTNLREWLESLRQQTVLLLHASDMKDPALDNVVLQIKLLADDAYTGRVIPPETSPQPTIGSAGAVQAYSQAQYLAALTFQKEE